ncbi:hypothetical protein [Mycobacterium canetti]|uniref:hypothetical protein n=1 Tax=Mycobacterium canetti TaxID=78331 RepID=UPI001CD3ABE8|nr:hypothetical protein [Mycobacterium canetti]
MIRKAREALVDALVRDAQAALAALDEQQAGRVAHGGRRAAGVGGGQDVEAGEDGVFRIARRVARDRLISTVDVEARHGHKSRARTFDGYKSHFSVDPDEELITNVASPRPTPLTARSSTSCWTNPHGRTRRRHRIGGR